MKEEIIDIEALVQDDHNFNRGTEDGQRLMEQSFKEHGAGRSILLDKDGRIIAGNKSQRAAIAAGIKKVRVIETTGDELVAVKRTDVALDSAEGREMAFLDNLTTQVNLSWDEVELESVADEYEDFQPQEFGFEMKDSVTPDDFGEEFTLPEGDKKPFQQITFTFANTQADIIKEAVSKAKQCLEGVETFGNENGNGNALYLIVKQWAEQKK